jgi:hypothetical protein
MDYGKMILWVSEPLTKWDAELPKDSQILNDPPF